MKLRKFGRREAVQLAAIGAAAGVGLSACANSPTGPASGAPDQPGESQQPDDATEAGEASPSSQSAGLPKVDDSLIQGLTMVTLATDNSGIKASSPRFSGARNLTQACEVVRSRYLRGAAWEKSDSVEVSAAVVASSTDIVGLLFTGTVDGSTQQAALWYDARKSQTFSSPVLIEPYGWGAFAKAVKDAAEEAGLDTEKVEQALIERSAPYGAGPAMIFSTDGKLVLLFGSGVVADNPTELSLVADDWLSEIGVLAKEAAANPTEFTGEPSKAEQSFSPGKDRPKPSESLHAPTDGTKPKKKLPEPTPGGKVRPSTAIGYDPIVEPCIALTYDDGPGEGTPKLLDEIDKAKGTATFFQMGNSINSFPKTVTRIAQSGHEVASHTITHPDLAKQNAERLKKEISGNQQIISEIVGFPPLLFRPPYGSHNNKVDEVLTAEDLAIVMWSVDTNDWKHRNTDQTVSVAVSNGTTFTQPIVLMHDIHASTINAAAPIINQLVEKGFNLVSVSEMTVNTGGLLPGHAYCRGTGIQQEGFACKG